MTKQNKLTSPTSRFFNLIIRVLDPIGHLVLKTAGWLGRLLVASLKQLSQLAATVFRWLWTTGLPWLWQATLTVLDWIGTVVIWLINLVVDGLVKLLQQTKLGRTKFGKSLGQAWKQHQPRHSKTSQKNRPVLWGAVFVLIVFLPLAFLRLKTPQETEAAWFNDGWLYRKKVPITNSGSAQTDYQVAITLDTATLITAGKMQSDCDDIRVTDHAGKLLPHWVEESGAYACNDSDTKIWTKVPSIPTSGATILVYYGNSNVSSSASGNDTFEFFDDFSSDTLGQKWTGDTSNFSITGGQLAGTNNNYRIESSTSFTGDYEVITRSYTTTSATNGFEIAGFWAATNNSHGILNHNGVWYTRNDSSWLGQGAFTFTQWVRATNKVVGTSGSAVITGETSGTDSAANTNSGISNEYVALGRRYDNTNYDQTYDNDWDWILVRKAASTEPSTGTPASEEVSPAPVAYWKFDEGYGTTANDSSSSNYDGTFTDSPTWKSESECISDKCLYFDGTTSTDRVNATLSNYSNWTKNITISFWYKATNDDDAWDGILNINGGYGSGTRFLVRKDNSYNRIDWQTNYGDATPRVVNTGSNQLNIGEWHHVVSTYDGSNAIIYLDGKFIDSYSETRDITLGSSLQIGLAQAYFQGFIDEVKIYPYARTAAQIKADYASRGSSQGISTSFGTSQQQNFLSEGLVGYWKMDEASWDGTSEEVIDQSGNDNHGTSNCGGTCTKPTTGAGKFGNGGVFDGVDDYVGISYDNPTSATSVVAWFKRTGPPAGDYHIITGGANIEISINESGGGYIRTGVTTTTQGRKVFNSGSGLTDGNWHQVAMTYDGTSLKSFIDGEQTASNAVSGNLSGIATEIGRYLSNSYAANGLIDEVRIYNRALSPAEVRQLYNWAPGPVAHYKMDEGAGTTSINDSSGNGRTGTMNGSMTESDWVQGKYGKALDFDGNGDYIDAGSFSGEPISDPTDKNISFGAWINTNESSPSNNKYVISSGGQTGSTGVYMLQASGGTTLTTGVNEATKTWSTNTSLTPNQWHYIFATFSSSEGILKIYKDGVLVSSDSSSGSVSYSDSQSDLTLGTPNNSKGNYTWKGTIDDVRIYNYARTPGQIIQDMNAEHPIGGSPVGSQIAYYKFDEGYGATAYDQLGNNDITITSATWTNNGKIGKALSFDGSDDYLSANLIPSITKSGTYTISTWIYKTTSVTGAIIQNSNSGSDRNGLTVSNTTATFGYYDGASWHGKSGTINLNEWVHLVGVNNGGSLKLYINGKEQSGTSNPYVSSGGNLYIGKVDIDNRAMYAGLIDEVKIYNTALTPDEILLDYNQGASSVMGAVGTDTSGNASFSSDRSYCPPGDTTADCAPIAEWKFDEKTGSAANDTSGHGHNSSSFNGTPSWTQGKTGSALDFEADDNDWVIVPDHNDLDMATNDFTACLWINPETTGGQYDSPLDHREDAGTNLGYQFRWGASNQMQFLSDYGASSVSSNSNTLSTNTWYYLCAVVDRSGSQYLYQDGSLVDSDSISAYSAVDISHTDNLLIGSTGSTSYDFDGKIDQVRIYDYARTPAQIAYDYNRGKPVGHWKLDECQGTTAYDSSGNENNGTITIGATGSNTSAGTCSSGTGTEAWNNGTTGKRNYSLDFDGTDDYVNLNAINIVGQNEGSISAWINADNWDANRMTVFSSEVGPAWVNLRFVLFSNSNNSMTFSVANGSSSTQDNVNTGAILSTDTWYHVVGTYNGSAVKIYVNGVEKDSYSSSITPGSFSATKTMIGWHYSNRYWNGQIDDVRIYNYALNATQIKTLYNDGAIKFGPSEGSP